MIEDAGQLAEGASLDCDVCVVGAGAAGITLARQLAGRGLAIAVLEAGGEQNDDVAREAFHGGSSTGPLEVDPISCRMRHFGGSTNHWVGYTRPIEAQVFDGRPWMPGSGWPVSAAALEPYDGLAREACEIGADEWTAAGPAARAGLALLPLDPTRVESVLYQFSPPTRFGVRYRAELLGFADVTVWLHATLVELALEPSGAAVSELRCVGPEGASFTVNAAAYVLALGGIETPRVLLAAGQLHGPVGLGHAWTGRGFMDHPHASTLAYLITDDSHDLSFYTGDPVVETRGPDGTSAAVRARAALALPASRRAALGLRGLALTPSPSSLDGFAELSGEADGAELRRLLARGGAPTGAEQLRFYRLTLRAEQAVDVDHRVGLSDALDAHGVPRVAVHWDVLDADIDSYRASLRLIGAELGRAGVGRLHWHDDPARIREQLWAGCHHIGTTRMASEPDDGVVDPDCRVHGVDNLWIAGSSVFPQAGYANPTLTIVALAYRLGDHLAQVLG